MVYNFKDINNDVLLKDISVFILTGKYAIFNNYLSDKIKGTIELNNLSVVETDDEFGIDDGATVTSTTVDINTFFEVCSVPSIMGKWYCRVDIKSLNKKQIESVIKYLKHPSEHGILVLQSTDYNEYKQFLKLRDATYGKRVSLYKLSFPNRKELSIIVDNMFNGQMEKRAIELFIIKMSTEYDKYEDETDEIMRMHNSKECITYDLLKEYMHGVQYFTVENFVYELVNPLSSEKAQSKKIFKMYETLSEQIGAENIVSELYKIVNNSIKYRVLINKGMIPIKVQYNINAVNKLINKNLGDKNEFTSINEYVFRNRARIASLTTLRDWIYIKLIIDKAIGEMYTTDSRYSSMCEIAMFKVMIRSIMSRSRLNNSIGVENINDLDINNLDKVKYSKSENTNNCNV